MSHHKSPYPFNNRFKSKLQCSWISFQGLDRPIQNPEEKLFEPVNESLGFRNLKRRSPSWRGKRIDQSHKKNRISHQGVTKPVRSSKPKIECGRNPPSTHGSMRPKLFFNSQRLNEPNNQKNKQIKASHGKPTFIPFTPSESSPIDEPCQQFFSSVTIIHRFPERPPLAGRPRRQTH